MSILGYSEDRFESFGSGGYKDWGYELKFGSKTCRTGHGFLSLWNCWPINIYSEQIFSRADIYCVWCSAFCLMYDPLNQLIVKYVPSQIDQDLFRMMKSNTLKWVSKLSDFPFHQSYRSQLRYLIDLNFNIWIIRTQVAPSAIRE